LSEQEKSMFASVGSYVCPTRRGTGKSAMSDPEARSSGPIADYSMVFTVGPASATAYVSNQQQTLAMAVLPWDSVRSGIVAEAVGFNHGPFMAASIDPDKTSHSSYSGEGYGIKSWKGRVGLERWADGTSNQLIFGERNNALDKLTACNLAKGHHDCTFLAGSARDANCWTIGRGFMLSSNPNNATTFQWLNIAQPKTAANLVNPIDYASFGSWHPGVCNFLLGDGAVRSVSVATAAENVLYPLSHCSDGAAVQLP